MLIITKQRYGPNADIEWCRGAQQRFFDFIKDKLGDMFVHGDSKEVDGIVTVTSVATDKFDEAAMEAKFAEYPTPVDFATLMNPDIYMTEFERTYKGPQSMLDKVANTIEKYPHATFVCEDIDISAYPNTFTMEL